MTTVDRALLLVCMKLGYAFMKVDIVTYPGKYDIEFNTRGKDDECFASFVREMRNLHYYVTEVDLISKTNFIIKIETDTFYCSICKTRFKKGRIQ